MGISDNFIHIIVKNLKAVPDSLLRSPYVYAVKNFRVSLASELFKDFLLNAKTVHSSGELCSQVMECHFQTMLL